MYEHPLDRMVRPLRRFVIAGIVISAPVALLSYGWMATLVVSALPWWASLTILLAHVFTLLSLGFLLDEAQERLSS
jgi:hypothetical protein